MMTVLREQNVDVNLPSLAEVRKLITFRLIFDIPVLKVFQIKHLCIMDILRKQIQGLSEQTWPPTILEALEETRAFKSTLAVDKIYGLLSLFSQLLRDVDVDYSIPVEDIFTKFAVNRLQESLSVLYDGTPPITPSGLKLPSWVADRAARGHVEPFRVRELQSHAAGDTKSKFNIGIDNKFLKIYGKLVDRIAQDDTLRPIPSVPKDFNHHTDGKFQPPGERLAACPAEVQRRWAQVVRRRRQDGD
jgi:hypothetical protein